MLPTISPTLSAPPTVLYWNGVPVEAVTDYWYSPTGPMACLRLVGDDSPTWTYLHEVAVMGS